MLFVLTFSQTTCRSIDVYQSHNYVCQWMRRTQRSELGDDCSETNILVLIKYYLNIYIYIYI